MFHATLHTTVLYSSNDIPYYSFNDILYYSFNDILYYSSNDILYYSSNDILYYRVIQKKCKSLGESSSVQCLLHPTNFLFCKCTNVLANREKKNFLNISKMQKVVTL